MIRSIFSRLIILLFGTLYPAYSSYKAVRTKNVKEYVRWMMYWIVFALFTCAETFTDIFLSFWFPFYYEFKVTLFVYLLLPATNGSSILYRKFVHPVLTKKEQEIDECIAKAMEQCYHTMLNLGSKSVAYATSVIMQTAIRGGGGLVNHIRKSYSLDDVYTREAQIRVRDETDEGLKDDRQNYRRRKNISPRRTISSGSQVDLYYYPEMDDYKRSSVAVDNDILGHLRSSEDISSGYSSTEPIYTQNKDLSRTNSMGPASRTRTRTARKTTSEDESGCSTTEPDESQCETDDFSRPMPIPHSNIIASFVKPEYQYLFANLTPQQMLTFINNANCLLTPAESNMSVHQPSAVLRSIISDDSEKEKVNEEINAKSSETRCGKYKKRPAPVPPAEEEAEFRTPESSPLLGRKTEPVFVNTLPPEDVGCPLIVKGNEIENSEEDKSDKAEVLEQELGEKREITDHDLNDKSEKKTKAKGKGKSGESHLSKMLHLSKIQLPFWHQKTAKHSPGHSGCSSISDMSRNSSHLSLNTKGDQDSYISLKGDDTHESSKTEAEVHMNVREMSQSPSSKRHSFTIDSP